MWLVIPVVGLLLISSALVLAVLAPKAAEASSTPSISTTLSPSSIAAGGSVTDTAQVTDGSSPTGTVTFYEGNTSNLCLFTGGIPFGSPVTLSGGSATSSRLTFNTAGTYYWKAEYNGDSNNNKVTSACETLSVLKASPSLSITLSAKAIRVRDSAYVAGTNFTSHSPTAGGNITYEYFYGSTCTGTPHGVGTVPVRKGVVPSAPFVPLFSRAGSFSWNAVYTGDSNNDGTTSPCVLFPVTTATGNVKTNLFAVGGFPINITGSVTGSVSLTGYTPDAGGTVTYNFFNDKSCGGSPIVTPTPTNGLIVTVTNGTAPPSPPETFSSAVTYSWNTLYSGDANNAGAIGTCVQLKVSKASPVITLNLNPTAFPRGQSTNVSVIVSRRVGFQPTDSVTYTYYNGGACEGSSHTIGPVTLSNSGSSSFIWTPDYPGSYSWNVVYSGDKNNGAVSSQWCKSVVVYSGSVSITIHLPFEDPVTASATVSPGYGVTASATLSGVTGSAGGTVTYDYFSGSGCSGAAKPAGPPRTVTNGTVPDSYAQNFSKSGTYSWHAVYSGDPSNKANNGATSKCEVLNVGHLAITSLTVSCSHTSMVVGSATTCKAKVRAPETTPTGNVTWSSSSEGNFSSKTKNYPGDTCKLSNGVCSVTFKSTTPGSPVILTVKYGGDSNDYSVPNVVYPAGTLDLNVIKKTPTITASCSSSSLVVSPSKVNQSNPLATQTKPTNAVTCTVKVKGYGDLTGDSVFWAQGNTSTGIVSFSDDTCTLVGGSCSVTLTGVQVGSVKVTAEYLGDPNNKPGLWTGPKGGLTIGYK